MRVGYRLTWPLAGIHLHNSKRVRVLLINNQGDILLVKSTYGTQKWELPGGGIARGEAPHDAAVREVYEETGIKLSQSNLKHLGKGRVSSRETGWPVMDVTFYKAAPAKVVIKVRRPLEIVDLQWFSRAKLPDDLGNCAKAALKLEVVKK